MLTISNSSKTLTGPTLWVRTQPRSTHDPDSTRGDSTLTDLDPL